MEDSFPLGRSVNSDRIQITSYREAIEYMIQADRFSLEEAIAVHLMNLDLSDRIHSRENRTNHKMTNAEIDEFVDNVYSTRQLDRYKREAISKYTEYKGQIQQQLYTDKVAECLGTKGRLSWLRHTYRGAWHGFWGNALTGLIILLFLIGAKVVSETNTTLAGMAMDYYHGCISPLTSFKH